MLQVLLLSTLNLQQTNSWHGHNYGIAFFLFINLCVTKIQARQ